MKFKIPKENVYLDLESWLLTQENVDYLTDIHT